MGSVAHFSTPYQTESNGKMIENKNNKIPQYAKDYRNEYLDDITFSVKLKEYIEGIIKMEKNIIYDYLLSLVSFAIKYFLNPTKDNLKIVDWYFIDLMIKKDKIIVRGMFYDLGLFIEDQVLVEGILELESRINEMNDSDGMDDSD